MKERRREKKLKFEARSMLPRNVHLPPTLIKGEYNGFNGGVIFPNQVPDRQSDLMKYPFVDNVINEEQLAKDPTLSDWFKKIIPIAEKGIKHKQKWDKAKLKQERYDRNENVKTAKGIGSLVKEVAGKKTGDLVGNIGTIFAKRSGRNGRWL